mgnify:CR=1 FL=1
MFVRFEFKYKDFEKRMFTYKFNGTDKVSDVVRELKRFFELCQGTRTKMRNDKITDFFSSTSISSTSTSAATESISREPITIRFVDQNQALIKLDEICSHALKENHRLLALDHEFPVKINYPAIKSVKLEGHLYHSARIRASLLFDSIQTNKSQLDENSHFRWFYSSHANLRFKRFKSNDDESATISTNAPDWIELDSGVNKRVIYLNKSTVKRFIRVIVTPNDGARSGEPIEYVSERRVEAKVNLKYFPMAKRFALTRFKCPNSK